MTNQALASELIDAILAADRIEKDHGSREAYATLRFTIAGIIGKLVASEPSYGHAERLNKLTGG